MMGCAKDVPKRLQVLSFIYSFAIKYYKIRRNLLYNCGILSPNVNINSLLLGPILTVDKSGEIGKARGVATRTLIMPVGSVTKQRKMSELIDCVGGWSGTGHTALMPVCERVVRRFGIPGSSHASELFAWRNAYF